MTVLLDTCTFIWLCSAPQHLSPTVRTVLDDSKTELAISDASVLEITLKWKSGKLKLPQPPGMWVEEQCETWQTASLPIERNDIYRVSELPDHHRDPFDRLLIAMAMNRSIAIVTPDDAIHKYPVGWMW